MNGNYYIPKHVREGYSYEKAQYEKENSIKKYSEFVGNVKDYYLSEAINYVLGKCLSVESADINQGKIICETFVHENGYDNLMRQFKTRTYTLALIEQCVSEAVKRTTDKTDKDNCLTWTITDTERQKFFDSLKDLPVDQLTKVINKKVCDAAEDFVQRSINMKLDIEEIASKTKERIDAAKEKYDEKAAQTIQKEHIAMYKKAVNDIKSKTTRTVYEHMMNLTSKAVLENKEIMDSYLNESGKFDMGKVEQKVRTMYTFLEMVNSLRIKKVDNKYIQECLASIGH